MTSLAIIISDGPGFSQRGDTAFKLAEAAIKSGVKVNGVFFYQHGTLNASAQISVVSDEVNWHHRWQSLHQQHQIPLYLCLTASQRRGVVDAETAKQENIQTSMGDAFIASGLGELVVLIENSDRVVQL